MVRLAPDEPSTPLKYREGTISTPFRKKFAIICLSPVSREDYFKDEAKIYFFDLAGLLDSPDSPAKKAALDAYDAARETRTWRPLERHRLDLFYEDGPEEMKQASVFRELMAGLQYRSVKPIRPVEEMNRLLAQQQVVIRVKP
jgi:hypothetical protein